MATEPKPAAASGNAPTLTRSALERVLARAAELQAAGGDTDEFGAMTEAQLVDLGKEVGLSADVLRQAMAEERSRAIMPEERGVLGSVAGVATVTASRTMRGTPSQVLGALDSWMQNGEALQVKRRFADQLVWEARRDFAARIRRAFTGRTFDFTPATDVSGIAAPAGADKVHVRLVADFSAARERRVEMAIIAAIAMSITGVPLRIIGLALPLAVIPPLVLAIAAFVITRRQYRAMILRAQLALEQALDRLEFGDAKPPSAGQALLDAFVGTTRTPRRP
jgi:hypothetical protein